jgi:hypothetical protein
MLRRLTHTAHHRGQQMAMLRMLGRDLHSNYGPTADTGRPDAERCAHDLRVRQHDAMLEGEAPAAASVPCRAEPAAR